MGVMFLIVFFLVSFLIVGLVLLQEGKGGGLTGMSAGMDGVMGAKNPLRRMTAYLFVLFVLMAICINWYFHQRDETAVPAGVEMPETNIRELQETSPAAGPEVQSEPAAGGAALRPEIVPETVPSAPMRPESAIEMPPPPADTPAAENNVEMPPPATALRPEPPPPPAVPAPVVPPVEAPRSEEPAPTEEK